MKGNCRDGEEEEEEEGEGIPDKKEKKGGVFTLRMYLPVFFLKNYFICCWELRGANS